ncbi:hypothetical protein [Bacillus sp. JJ722]|uniref:hypothetical protein n=1 Tax=Bacillus sp. JJ722 TaxID=3122973 RepID=UPI003000E71E
MLTYLSKVIVTDEKMVYKYGLTKDKLDGLIEVDRLDFNKAANVTLASEDGSRGQHAVRAIANMIRYHRNNEFPDKDMRASG